MMNTFLWTLMYPLRLEHTEERIAQPRHKEIGTVSLPANRSLSKFIQLFCFLGDRYCL